MFQLELMGETRVVSRHTMSPVPFTAGRAPSNDLVLADETVSGRHLRAWVQDGVLLVEDLKSRNGTWFNGERLAGTRVAQAGDQIRVGERTRLRVAWVDADAPALPELEDCVTGDRHAFRTDRFNLDLLLPEASVDAAWLVVHPDGEVWLEGSEVALALTVDEIFTVRDRRFCLRRPAPGSPTTVDAFLAHELPRARYPYELEARLDGPTGPEATLLDVETRRVHTVTADNRALLLYLLARRVAADASGGLAPAAAGWCADEDVAIGIWGRTQAAQQLGNLNVLVWRVRREFQTAGFDPACIEKRKRHLRIRVERARAS